MDNSNYEESESDKDVDLSLNCSVDQSFRLNNTLIEKKDSNSEQDKNVIIEMLKNNEKIIKNNILFFLLFE